MKNEIIKIIQKAVKDFQKDLSIQAGDLNFSVEIPGEKSHGDYSTNIALILARKLGKNPREAAELIKQKIELFSARGGPSSGWKKIEVAGPGFINFFVADKIFTDNLKNIDKNYGRGKELRNKKIIIDYTDPNPFKEFHIGHLMNNVIGESLSRIFEFQEAKVKRVCYQGDVGIHIAKAIWGILNLPNNQMLPKDRDLLEVKMKFLSMAYAYGSRLYEESEEAKKEIIILNKKIFERSDKKINKIYDKGKKWSLEHFDEIYKILGTKFDYFIFESQVSNLGKKVVEKGLKKGVFKKGDNGAVIFKGEKYGLHTRVFINSEGLPTYEAKDLGLAELKYKKYAYDQSFIITGNEVKEYFKVMLCAMAKINPDLAKKTKHIGHGMIRLPEGKMSSRTGDIITGELLIEKVKELVNQKIGNRELLEKEKKEVAEKVAIGAIKYSVLKQSIGSDIVYDFEKSISFEGDSGPYLQYSFARAMSVLRKANSEKIKASFKKISNGVGLVEKMMYYFPEMVEKAGKEYQPHYITLYLTELAGAFNSYYAKNKIVDNNDIFSPYKVALTTAFTTIMKNGMWLLGIDNLKKM